MPKDPFFKKAKDSMTVRLHKDLYEAKVIEQIKKEEPNTVKAVQKKQDYYLVELDGQDRDSGFDFINYLIYRTRNQ